MALVTWDNLTLCTYKDGTDIISDMDSVLIMDGDEAIQRIFEHKRDTYVKGIMLQELQVVFQQRFPTTTAQWITFASSMVDVRKQRAQYQFNQSGVNAITPPIGYYQIYFDQYDGVFSDFVLAYGVPRSFYWYGVPTDGTSGTYAGSAQPGSMLSEGQYGRLYVNRGTLASPTWQYFIPKDLKDYLSNPSVLTYWAAAETIQACIVDGMFRSRMRTSNDMTQAFLLEAQKSLRAKVKEYKALALQLIDIDLSGNGTISEFATSSQVSSDYFA